VEDINGDMIDWFRKAGFSKEAVAILRPDRFIFAVVPVAALNRALTRLRDQLGEQEGVCAPFARVSTDAPSVANAA
jgi:3-(3-hydroxy-phenyl)propionate hydroxylase